MPASVLVGEHVRRNVVAYLALFIALTGTSYAATKVTSRDIKKNAVLSKHVNNGELKGKDVADDALTGEDIDETTLQGLDGELNAFRTQLQSAGTLNAAGNPVDFTNLKNVPAGFADGTDNTGAAPANNSLGAAEPATADDEISDNTVDTEDVTNGSLANADIAAGAAIDDAKLATIDQAGKVADSALSSNVALLGANQTFAGNNIFGGNVSLISGNAEGLAVTSTHTADDITPSITGSLFNNTTSEAQEVGLLVNANGSTGSTESLLRMANFDDQSVADGLLLESNAGGIDTAIDASDGDVDTAIDVGANDIATSGATISSTELQELDGDPVRSVSIPTGAWMNVSTPAVLNFAVSDGTSPDFALVNDSPVIEWDDNSSGVADNEYVGTTIAIPSDYSSGGTLHIGVSKDGHSGTPERIVCDFAVNGAAPGAAGTATTVTTVLNYHTVSPAGALAPNQALGIRCLVDDGAGGETANDVARIHSVRFAYNASR